MSSPIAIELRSAQSGQIQTLMISEIVSIDGKPYTGEQEHAEGIDAAYQAIRQLEGQLAAQQEQINNLTNFLMNKEPS